MDDTIQVLNKLMDISALRQRVLANNMANINTPGYKRLDVSFREELAGAINSGNVRKIDDVQPVIAKDTDAPARPDGNTTSLQDEMAEMAENSVLYQMCTKAITAKFNRLHSAVKGR